MLSLREQLAEGDLSLQAAATFTQSLANAAPILAIRVRNRARITIGPVTVFTLEGTRPPQNLAFRKWCQVHSAANTSMLRNEERQRCASTKPTFTVCQSEIYSIPRFIRSRDASRVLFRPFAIALMILIHPGKDLFDGVFLAAEMPADPVVTLQKLHQRRLPFETTSTPTQRLIDPEPSLTVSADGTTRGRWKVSMFTAEAVNPLLDRVHGKLRERFAVQRGSLSSQQTSQARSAWQTTSPIAQCHFHRLPSLASRVRYQTRFSTRPSSVALVILVSPEQDLFDGVLRQLLRITVATVLGEETWQGLSTTEATHSFAQRLIDVGPFLFGETKIAILRLRPATVLLPPLVSPVQDLRDGKLGTVHSRHLTSGQVQVPYLARTSCPTV